MRELSKWNLPVVGWLNASLLTGLGSGFGWILYRAGQSFLQRHDRPAVAAHGTGLPRFLLEFAVIGLFLASFWHPIDERLRKLLFPLSASRSAASFQLIRAALFGLGLLLELLVHRVDENRSTADLVIAVALAGSITFGWCYGYRRRLFGAARWGTLAGFTAGLFVVLGIWYIRGGILFDSVTGGFARVTFTRALAVAINNAVLLWAVIGFFGGIAADLAGASLFAGPAIAAACLASVMAVDALQGVHSWGQDLAMLLGWSAMLIVPPNLRRALRAR